MNHKSLTEPLFQRIEVLGKCILVACYVDRLFEAVLRACSTFPQAFCGDAVARLDIFEGEATFEYAHHSISLKIPCHPRNMYQLFFACIYTFSAHENFLAFHSAVVSRDEEGIMILGGFGQGKTALSYAYRRAGYVIHSGDHSILQATGSDLFFLQGTKRIADGNHTEILDDGVTMQGAKIVKIVLVVGACDGGIVSETLMEDEVRRMQRLWPSVSWPYFTPLVGSDSLSLQPCMPTNLVLSTRIASQIPIPISILRGDLRSYTQGSVI